MSRSPIAPHWFSCGILCALLPHIVSCSGEADVQATNETTATVQQNLSAGRVVAYIDGTVGNVSAAIAGLDATKYTHINYAFANLDSNGNVYFTYPTQDGANINAIKGLKSQNPNLKILISVGGWTWSNHFSTVTADSGRRANMVSTAWSLVNNNGVDGIDIDWEWPGWQGEGDNAVCAGTCDGDRLRVLMQDLWNSRNGKLVTMAGGAHPNMGAYVDLGAISNTVDFLNIMTYDFHGPWEPAYAPHANVYGGDISIDSAVNMYLGEGFPAGKLVVGIPFYGKAWGMSDPSPLYKNISCSGTQDGASCSVNGIGGHTLHYDTAKQAAYMDGAGHYISFDNLVSVGWKTSYINNKNGGLGGAMYWSALQDNGARDLTNKIWADVGATGGGGGGSAAPVNGNAYSIRPSHSSNKCADIANYSLSSGANVSQYDCHSGYNQRFWAVDRGGGYFAFVNAGSAQCLDQNPGNSNGMNIVQWACHYGDNQLWMPVDSGSGFWRLVNKSSGLVMEVSGNQSQSNGANIQTWTYDGSGDMKWRFVGVSGKMAFRSYNFGTHYMTARDNYEAWIENNTTDSSAFRVVPGLADTNCISFQSSRFPDRYLRHSGYVLWAHQNNGTSTFANDATFCVRASLAGDGGYRSFESKNFPDHYIRHAGGRLRIDPFADNATYRADASWQYATR